MGELGEDAPVPTPTVREAIGDLPALENGEMRGASGYGDAPPSEWARCMRGGLNACDGHDVSCNSAQLRRRMSEVRKGQCGKDMPPAWHADGSADRRRFWGLYHRLEWDRPAPLLGHVRKNVTMHPDANRVLSVREAQRLFGMPDAYSLRGGLDSRQQQIANSVPPHLAQAAVRRLLARASSD